MVATLFVNLQNFFYSETLAGGTGTIFDIQKKTNTTIPVRVYENNSVHETCAVMSDLSGLA